MTRGLPSHLRAWFLRGPVVRELREMLGAVAPAGHVLTILGAGTSAPESTSANAWRDVDGRRVAVLPLAQVSELCGVRSPGTSVRLNTEPAGEGCAWCCYLEHGSATTWRLPLHPPKVEVPPRAAGDA